MSDMRTVTREQAVEKALLYTFQLSNKDYRKMQTALSEVAFIRALEQDGFTVAASRPVGEEGLREALERGHLMWVHMRDCSWSLRGEPCDCGLAGEVAALAAKPSREKTDD